MNYLLCVRKKKGDKLVVRQYHSKRELGDVPNAPEKP